MKTFLLILFFTSFNIYCQTEFGSINGKIVDPDLGEPLIGANIKVINLNKGAASDTNGYFEIKHIPYGQYNIYCKFIGYPDKIVKVELNQLNPNVFVNIELVWKYYLKLEGIEDTVHFDGFRGFIRNKTYTPKGSKNIFPKVRFTPSVEDIVEAENNIRSQYLNAIKQWDKLFYEELKANSSEEDWEIIEKEREEFNQEYISKVLEYIKVEYYNYDREYYGFIYNNSKNIRIEFLPHKAKYFEIGGELHMKNLGIMVFNLTSGKLSFASWEGE